MKRTSRLTALILVLLMLVNISASATTTTGIPLSELDIYDFETMTVDAMSAAEDEGGPVLSEPCSEDNVYCGLVSELVALPTAQERYDYMMNLYNSEDETDTTLEGTMLHYYYYKTEHNAEGLICECDFPSLAPEYQPGALSVHEADCPWTFANLSVSEQYAVVKPLMLSDRAPYIATLSAEQAAALETYTAQQEGTLSYPCEEKPEYCQFDVYSNYTASELYNYFNSIYADENGEISEQYAAMMLHYGEYHLDSNLICTCGEHPLPLPEYQIGDISKHEAECPWHFANLTVPEQYTVYTRLATSAQPAYKATLSAEQTAALETYTAQQEGTLSYPCEEKPEYCQFDVYSNYTASELYDYFNSIYADENGEISEQYAAMMLHYGEYHLDSNLICTCGEHPLPLPEYQIGDISKHEAECPWHFANLTVPEQYTVYTKLATSARPVYKATLNEAQATELEDYILNQSSSAPCDGEECGFNAFAALSGAERHEQLIKWIGTEASEMGNMYNVFINHVYEKHASENAVCVCSDYQSNYDNLFYGSRRHVNGVDWNFQPVDCPWHFTQIPLADQKKVIDSLTDQTEKDSYLALLGDDVKDKLDRVNVNNYTASTDDNASVKITVPEGAFDVDYIMNAVASALNELQKKAMEAVQIWRQLAVFDISFEALSDGSKLQPNNNSPVQLTFTVDVSNVHGNKLHVHHLKQNEDGTYTAESLGTVDVDKTQTTQTITVTCPSFSYIALSDECDGSSCYEYNADIVYNHYVLMAQPTAEERYVYLNELYTKVLNVTGSETDAAAEQKAFVDHLKEVHSDCLSLICSCGIYPIPAVGDPQHADNCPWSAASQSNTIVVNGDPSFKPETDMTIYVPDGAFANGYKVEAAPVNDLNSLPVDMNALDNMHNFAAFDVKFLTADGASVQAPSDENPVTLNFNVSTSSIHGLASHLVVHYLYADENGGYTFTELQRDKLDSQFLSQVVSTTCSKFPSIITVSYYCDGSACGFKAIIEAEDGFAREAELRKLVASGEYDNFTTCVENFHYDDKNAAGQTVNDLICICSDYPYDPDLYAYGSLNHGSGDDCLPFGPDDGMTYVCPWHFNQLPLEEQVTVLAGVAEADRATYIATEEDEAQREELNTLISGESFDLKVQVIAKHGATTDVLSWLTTATTEMMELALQASSLDSVMLIDQASLLHVRSNQTLADYAVDTNMVTDIETGLSFSLDRLTETAD